MRSHAVSVAILHHKDAPREYQEIYLLSTLAHLWRFQGIKVHHLYGTADHIPADVVFVHVDLSVVPRAYSSFAKQYPVALNATVLDIRKRKFSTLALRTPDAYEGPVIVKTDLNCGGLPERVIRDRIEPTWLKFSRHALHKLAARLGWSAPSDRVNHPSAYEVYPSSTEVPAVFYRDSRLIVEKFVPERRGQQYCHRRYFFLGDAEVNQVWFGTSPVCAMDSDQDDVEDVPVPPQLRNFRDRFGIDYGKIDYVLGKQGEVIVLDINKTPVGASPDPADLPWLRQLCGDLHTGIKCFLPSPGGHSLAVRS